MTRIVIPLFLLSLAVLPRYSNAAITFIEGVSDGGGSIPTAGGQCFSCPQSFYADLNILQPTTDIDFTISHGDVFPIEGSLAYSEASSTWYFNQDNGEANFGFTGVHKVLVQEGAFLSSSSATQQHYRFKLSELTRIDLHWVNASTTDNISFNLGYCNSQLGICIDPFNVAGSDIGTFASFNDNLTGGQSAYATLAPTLGQFEYYGLSVNTHTNARSGTDPFDSSPLPGQIEVLNLHYDVILTESSAIPLPAAFWLFGSAFFSLIGIRKLKIVKMDKC